MKYESEKWEAFWGQYPKTSFTTNYGAHFHLAEALYTTKRLQALPAGARLLSLGTGLGQVELLLVSGVLGQEQRQFVATDIVPSVLQKFRSGLQSDGGDPSISVLIADAFRLPFASSAFDAVISFGVESVAAFRGAQQEVARVLKPGGVLVFDAINHFSPYYLTRRGMVSRFRAYRRGGTKYVHFCPWGIKALYEPLGFKMVSSRHLAAVPPVRDRLTVAQYQALERFWPLKRFFGRFVIFTFIKG